MYVNIINNRINPKSTAISPSSIVDAALSVNRKNVSFVDITNEVANISMVFF